EERDDSRFRHLDHVLPERAERERASRSGVHHGRGAGAQTVKIWLDAVMRGAGKDVDVKVDQTRRDKEAARFQRILARRGLQIARRGAAAPAVEAHVEEGVRALRGIENVPASDQHGRTWPGASTGGGEDTGGARSRTGSSAWRAPSVRPGSRSDR